jgi:hypothetical protein
MKKPSKADWLKVVNKQNLLFSGLYDNNVKKTNIKRIKKNNKPDIFHKNEPINHKKKTQVPKTEKETS